MVFDWLAKAVLRTLEAFLALCMLAMVFMVFGNVVLRYGFGSSIVVSEELSRFAFLWMTFVGAVVAMHEGAHLGVDTLHALPGLSDQVGAMPHGAGAVADELGNFFGGTRTALGQTAYFGRHNGKAPALFPRPGGLDGGIQGQDVGLECNAVNHPGDV